MQVWLIAGSRVAHLPIFHSILCLATSISPGLRVLAKRHRSTTTISWYEMVVNPPNNALPGRGHALLWLTHCSCNSLFSSCSSAPHLQITQWPLALPLDHYDPFLQPTSIRLWSCYTALATSFICSSLDLLDSFCHFDSLPGSTFVWATSNN